MICRICNQEFENTFILSHHIRKHKLESEVYYVKFLKKENEGLCKECSKKTKFISIRDGYSIFCSKRCCLKYQSNKNWKDSNFINNHKLSMSKVQKTQNYKTTIGKSMKKVWKRNGVRDLVSSKLKEIWKDKESTFNSQSYKNQVRESNLKTWKSKDLRDKLSLKLKDSWSNNYERKDQLRKRMLRGDSSYMRSFLKRVSKPQLELYHLVKELYEDAKIEFQIKQLNKSIDVAIPSLKVAIEYDCSYWHQDKNNDVIRQEQIQTLSWRFLRYTDYVPSLQELKSDIENLKEYNEKR